MYISNQLTATQVWAAASKVLTSLGPACLTGQSADNAAIANGATVVFTSTGTDEGMVTVVGIAAANVTFNVGLSNNTTFRSGQSFASAASAIVTGCFNSAEAVAINNSGTVSGNYTYASMKLH